VGDSSFYVGGDIVPFDISFGFLVVGGVLVQVLWSEKYKEVSASSTNVSKEPTIDPESRQCTPTAWIPTEAVMWMASRPIALLLMLGSACTEAAMYSFVIEWTPALTTSNSRPPLGLVFAAFMLSYMAGSTLLGWVSSPTADSALLIATSAVGALAMGVAALLTGLYPENCPLQATYMTFVCMCIFEACLGAYYVLVGSVKAKEIPENLRAAIYGIFRVPLNVMVVVLQLSSPSTAVSLLVSSVLLVVAVVCFTVSHNTIKKNGPKSDAALAAAPTEASPLNAPLVKD